MRILGVSLSQFHDKAGFQLVISIPEQSVLSQEQFKLYSDLILPRQQLCDRILAIEFKDDYFLVVNPLLSQNKDYDKTYKREKYIYSLSILVDKSEYLNKVKQPIYKQLVSKIAKFVKIIEESNHIIYDHPKYREYICSLLQYYYSQVNQKGSCDLTFLCGNYTFINANYPPHIQDSAEINGASVPVTTLCEREINKIESQLGKKLLEYAYKGTFSFRKICRMHRDKKQAELKSFYIKAVEKGVVFILDMLNLNNCYTLTKKIKQYLPDQPKHNQLKQIADSIQLKQEEDININQLLCLYLQFSRVNPLYKIIEYNRKFLAKVDFTKLIRLGQIHGFLKRLHQKITYSQIPSPLILADPLKKYLQEREKGQAQITEKLVREEINKITDAVKNYLNTKMTVDQIAVNLQIDQDRLLKLLNPTYRFVLLINP